MNIYLLPTLLFIAASSIYGFPSGAPENYCDESMLPKHKVGPSTDPSPVERFHPEWMPDEKSVLSLFLGFHNDLNQYITKNLI